MMKVPIYLRQILLFCATIFWLPSVAQLKADAGEDLITCNYINGYVFEIGGSPSASGGVEPYTYAWSGKFLNSDSIENSIINASYILDDTTKSNPVIKLDDILGEWYNLFLKVEDANGEVAYDSVKIVDSTIRTYEADLAIDTIFLGDSVQFIGDPYFDDYFPLTYLIKPSSGLTDPTDIYGWAKPTSSIDYSLQATNSMGCIKQKRYFRVVVIDTVFIQKGKVLRDSITNLMVGTWNWLGSSEGYDDDITKVPSEFGYTIKLEIEPLNEHDSITFKIYKNNEIIKTGSTGIDFIDTKIWKTNNILPPEQMDIAYAGKDHYFHFQFLNKDYLYFSNQDCGDCTEYLYVRTPCDSCLPEKFVNSGNLWTISTVRYGSGYSLPPFSHYHKFKGYAFRNEKMYKIMYNSFLLGHYRIDFDYMWREDQSKKVYKISARDGKETLIYDFGLKKGDIFYNGEISAIVDSVVTKPFGSVDKTYLYLHYLNNSTHTIVWIEGIGSLFEPDIYDDYFQTQEMSTVVCFEDSSGFIYHNPKYEYCSTDNYTAIKDSLTNMLTGKWSWYGSERGNYHFGNGFGGPEQNGYTVTINIKKDDPGDSLLFWDYVNDTLVNHGKVAVYFYRGGTLDFAINSILPSIHDSYITDLYDTNKMIHFQFLNSDSIQFYNEIIGDSFEIYYKRVTSTGINRLTKKKSGIRFYPNPAKHEITIENTNNQRVKKIEIIDLSGLTIQSWSEFKDHENVLNIESIISGIYLLKIETEFGITTKKLIVQ